MGSNLCLSNLDILGSGLVNPGLTWHSLGHEEARIMLYAGLIDAVLASMYIIAETFCVFRWTVWRQLQNASTQYSRIQSFAENRNVTHMALLDLDLHRVTINLSGDHLQQTFARWTSCFFHFGKQVNFYIVMTGARHSPGMRSGKRGSCWPRDRSTRCRATVLLLKHSVFSLDGLVTRS
jgi:hypothetical protein